MQEKFGPELRDLSREELLDLAIRQRTEIAELKKAYLNTMDEDAADDRQQEASIERSEKISRPELLETLTLLDEHCKSGNANKAAEAASRLRAATYDDLADGLFADIISLIESFDLDEVLDLTNALRDIVQTAPLRGKRPPRNAHSNLVYSHSF